MLAGVAPSLFLRTLIDLATRGVSTFPNNTSYKDAAGLSWAEKYLYVILTTILFLLVAWIGCIKPRDLNYLSVQQKYNGAVPVEYATNELPTAYQPVQTHIAPASYSNGQPGYNYTTQPTQQPPYRSALP
jgi:hypothetical protein